MAHQPDPETLNFLERCSNGGKAGPRADFFITGLKPSMGTKKLVTLPEVITDQKRLVSENEGSNTSLEAKHLGIKNNCILYTESTH